MLLTQVENVSGQTTQADQAVVRIETKIEYIPPAIENSSFVRGNLLSIIIRHYSLII